MKRNIFEKLFPMSSVKNKEFTPDQKRYLKMLENSNQFIMGEDWVAIEYGLKTNGRELFTDTLISAGWWILILLPLIILLTILTCLL